MPSDEGRRYDDSIDRRRNHPIWIGPIIAFAGAISYFTFFARFPLLRDFPWVNPA